VSEHAFNLEDWTVVFTVTNEETKSSEDVLLDIVEVDLIVGKFQQEREDNEADVIQDFVEWLSSRKGVRIGFGQAYRMIQICREQYRNRSKKPGGGSSQPASSA